MPDVLTTVGAALTVTALGLYADVALVGRTIPGGRGLWQVGHSGGLVTTTGGGGATTTGLVTTTG